jgi:hypothetical protein
VRHFFESSHGKGPQDAAGGLLKNQADMAIVRGKAEIRCARDLYNFAEAKLKTTRSHNCKRRIFKYIEEVERNSKSFQPIRGIRAIHRIETLDSKRLLIKKNNLVIVGRVLRLMVSNLVSIWHKLVILIKH